MGAKKQTFEEALTRLEKVVRELEDGNIPLEKALELFAEGISLSKYCHRALEDAERKISVLTADDQGELVLREMPVRE